MSWISTLNHRLVWFLAGVLCTVFAMTVCPPEAARPPGPSAEAAAPAIASPSALPLGEPTAAASPTLNRASEEADRSTAPMRYRDEAEFVSQPNSSNQSSSTATDADSDAGSDSDQDSSNGKLRIICFGAHPDDCELRAAGVAAMWAERGHRVKFVSVTNGDIGHWQMAGGPLAQRRRAEVERCAEILGIESEVLDIHDGELMPTLENRRTITRLIRDWKADVVMCHRPNDYHPDHRNVGLLVQDAAFMVTVPFFCPDTPRLETNPVFLYFEDRFQKPNPFAPDMVVAIDDVIQKKMAAVEALQSQFFEGGCCSGMTEVPQGAAATARKKQVYDNFLRRFAATADRFRSRLVELYGREAGGAASYAEAFEVCEYGRQPSPDELRELFPFFPEDSE